MCIECLWLSETIPYCGYSSWSDYENLLYDIYLEDFIKNTPYILEKPVRVRKNPKIEGKDQTFFHITSNSDFAKTNDPNDRLPDLRRCERIKWPRDIIDNYICEEECRSCNKLKVWREKYKGNDRIHILFEDVNFLIVLEERTEYVLFITSFYMKYNHEVRKQIKKYERYIRSKKRL